MNASPFFLNGFVKRAAQYGYLEKHAVEMYKIALSLGGDNKVSLNDSHQPQQQSFSQSQQQSQPTTALGAQPSMPKQPTVNQPITQPQTPQKPVQPTVTQPPQQGLLTAEQRQSSMQVQQELGRRYPGLMQADSEQNKAFLKEIENIKNTNPAALNDPQTLKNTADKLFGKPQHYTAENTANTPSMDVSNPRALFSNENLARMNPQQMHRAVNSYNAINQPAAPASRPAPYDPYRGRGNPYARDAAENRELMQMDRNRSTQQYIDHMNKGTNDLRNEIDNVKRLQSYLQENLRPQEREDYQQKLTAARQRMNSLMANQRQESNNPYARGY